MPRLAPQLDGKPCVLEHRITFGTYERKQITEAIDAYRRDKWLENIPNMLIGVSAPLAAVGVGYGLYKVAQGIGTIGAAIGGKIAVVKDLVEDYEDGWQYFTSPGTWRLMAMFRWPGLFGNGNGDDHLHYQQYPTNDPQPWTVMGLTYGAWVEAGMPMETWTDYLLHHGGIG